ncbi:MAG: hypothetical protein ACF787_11385 [Rhodopirellula sp. JB053]|uniref:hypothetical protein n=1 Tax=Rhodopirellula sp. JB044 TaxID=3342844 RepID=UPI00370C6E90
MRFAYRLITRVVCRTMPCVFLVCGTSSLSFALQTRTSCGQAWRAKKAGTEDVIGSSSREMT